MMQDGIILIDKPTGMTSFGVVARVRRQLTEKKRAEHQARGYCLEGQAVDQQRRCRCKVKVGHTGTLDPFATGLMILVVGRECKNAGRYSKLDKVYEATVSLGATSSTGDPEGDIVVVSDIQPTRQQVEAVLDAFRGEISQSPPIYSAIKIGGQRAYKLARKGEVIEMPSRQVEIYELEVTDYQYPEVRLRAHVSSGTYIRSLAADIGAALGTEAYCSTLRRTRIADYDVADADTSYQLTS